MAFKLNNQFISIDRPFTAPDGTKYPNLRDASIRAALGVTEVADEPTYDQRFYWGVDNPKQLEDLDVTPEEGGPYIQKGLKSDWVAQVKQTAGTLLAQTDWMVIRKAERSVDIPAATQTYRAAVVAEADRLEAAILACDNVESLIAVVGAQNWPKE